MSWKNEQSIEPWSNVQPSHKVGVDAEGDIGIMDVDGYSIMLSTEGGRQLRDWLNYHFDDDDDMKPEYDFSQMEQRPNSYAKLLKEWESVPDQIHVKTKTSLWTRMKNAITGKKTIETITIIENGAICIWPGSVISLQTEGHLNEHVTDEAVVMLAGISMKPFGDKK